jgi:hypothetical protein
MTGTPTPDNSRRNRIIAIVVVAVVIAVIIGLVIFASLSRLNSQGPSGTATTPATAIPMPTGATPTFTPATPTPGPTGTAPPTSAPAVGFSKKVTVAPGVVVSVSKIEDVAGKASLPGEVAGPSLRFTVVITNSSSSTISLQNVVVNVYDGADQSPAIELSAPGAKAFPQHVSSGSSGSGVYVYNVPKADRNKVTLTLDYGVNSPTAVFTGAVK